MALTLILSSPDLNDESLRRLTSDLCLELRRKDVTASLTTQPGAADDKANDLPVWAQITVLVIPSVALLINVLTAWVQRNRSLTIKLEGIEITASNLDKEKFNQLFEKLTQLLAKYVKSEE